MSMRDFVCSQPIHLYARTVTRDGGFILGTEADSFVFVLTSNYKFTVNNHQ